MHSELHGVVWHTPPKPPDLHLAIECERVWGAPKLKKPRACKNVNRLSSAIWHNGSRHHKGKKCGLWHLAGRVYLHHTDWFSAQLTPEEAEAKGLLKAEDLHGKYGKFVYSDFHGVVILPNEAVLSFDLPSREFFFCHVRDKLLAELERAIGCPLYERESQFEGLFESVVQILEKEVER